MSGARVDDLTPDPSGRMGAEPALARLTEACRLAGLPDPAMVPEPVAAAGYFVSGPGSNDPRPARPWWSTTLAAVRVDASAVVPAQDGYRVLAMSGLTTSAASTCDAALLESVATVHRGQDPQAWQRLERT